MNPLRWFRRRKRKPYVPTPLGRIVSLTEDASGLTMRAEFNEAGRVLIASLPDPFPVSGVDWERVRRESKPLRGFDE